MVKARQLSESERVAIKDLRITKLPMIIKIIMII